MGIFNWVFGGNAKKPQDEPWKEGVTKDYYENGQLKMEANYKDGKLEGVAKFYYESGQLELEGNYKNDKREGINKEYYECGQLKLERNL